MDNGILNSDCNNSLKDEVQPQGSRLESEGEPSGDTSDRYI